MRARLDLVRGSLGFRWRTRPPFVQWLLWRFGDVTPATDHRDWLLDDTGGRFAGFRAQWLGWFGLYVLVLTMVFSDFGREPQVWMLVPVVVGLGISLMPRTWWARRLRTDLTKQEQKADLARSFDRAAPGGPGHGGRGAVASCSRRRPCAREPSRHPWSSRARAGSPAR